MEDVLKASGLNFALTPEPAESAEGLLDAQWHFVECSSKLARMLNTPLGQLRQQSLLTFFPGLDFRLRQVCPQNWENFVTLYWSATHTFHFRRQGEYLHFLLNIQGELPAVDAGNEHRMVVSPSPEDLEMEQQCMRLLAQLMSRLAVPLVFFHQANIPLREIVPACWLGNPPVQAEIADWHKGDGLKLTRWPVLAHALDNPPVLRDDCRIARDQHGHWLTARIRHKGALVAIIGGLSADPITDTHQALLERYGTIIWNMRQLSSLETQLAEKAAWIAALETGNQQLFRQLIHVVSEALELKDAYTASHQRSVAELAVGIGRRLGYDTHRLEGLRLGALVHDIGKLAIPNQILSKPDKLTEQEYALVQTHSARGAEIIGDIAFPWPIKQMILQHHERLDGSGYPNGLKGNEILEEAQILAVADIADSMLSHRPYRAALGVEALTEALLEEQGKSLRSDIVRHCLDEIAQSLHSISLISELLLRPVCSIQITHELKVEQLLSMLNDTREPYVALRHHSWLGLWDVRMLRRHLSLNCEKLALAAASPDMQTISANTSLDDGIKMLTELDHPLLVVDDDSNALGVLDWKTIAQKR
ncbi:HD-GYP domain-containing protein [Shewanella sp. GXUN23E]|uniref:HD-GYP domain-containing protein n=1 Tax=Shewanella sp. GXUN23E TaxID=3422498 RepID=UPI003D7C9821